LDIFGKYLVIKFRVDRESLNEYILTGKGK